MNTTASQAPNPKRNYTVRSSSGATSTATLTKTKAGGYTVTPITGTTEDRELDGGILMAETEQGQVEPIAIASTINEACEIARSDFRHRNPNEDICPYAYYVWERNQTGRFSKTIEIAL